jgi:carboxypeptidase C (cathepsin A)
MPLIVIVQDPNKPNLGLPADRDASFRQVHLELERDLLHLSQRSTFVIAMNSGHMIPFERPDLIAECVHRIASSKVASE